VAGLAIGVRSQSFVLTLPLLGLALVLPGRGLAMRDRLAAVVAAAVGSLAWAVPMLMASGGLDGYLLALGQQAGEDFGGVVMLWTNRTARVALDAMAYSFLWPWGTLAAGWIIAGVAVAGAVRLLVRRPLALATLVVAFAPYALFHVLFQETVTTRYAVPLVVPVAALAVYGFAGAGRMAMHAGAAAMVAWSLAVTLPGAVEYATRPAPAVSALRDALDADPQNPIGMHAVLRRTEQWYHDNASGRVIRQPHGSEVPALVERWLREPEVRITFLADPRRSDLALLDPRASRPVREYDWRFDGRALLGGVRPGAVRLLTLDPPGWMLGDGWALTAEIGGQTERAGFGPHFRPSVAWVRRRDGAATLMLGGRNLGPDGSADAAITVTMGTRLIAAFDAPPGFFLHQWELPAGVLAGREPYLPIEVAAAPRVGQGIRVGLEQFDLQPAGVPMVGFADGWQEPEYNQATGRPWRWMSDRARLRVRAVGRDVTLAITGESPLRYFDAPPTVRVSIGGQALAEFSPAADFTREIRIPAALLAGDRDDVLVESDRAFVPGGGDRRRLALRVYSVTVN
jgi:hypothetical protein